MSQIVVKDGVVIAICADSEELYNVYPHTTGWAYFDYAPAFSMTNYINVPEINISRLVNDIGGEGELKVVETTTKVPTMGQVADPRLAMTLADAKTAVISQLARICNYEILATYPLARQSEVTNQVNGYDSTALTTMKAFINTKYTTKTTKTGQVNALTTVADCIAYNVWA